MEDRFGASQLMTWARLLKRVFELDLKHCPNFGGELKIIAATVEAPVIEKVLTDPQALWRSWVPSCCSSKRPSAASHRRHCP